jgi:hypothetical protein
LTREGQFLKAVVHNQTGIKILQAFVQNGDFSFLCQAVAE